ncbi:DMT family transporter [Sporosarcina sp. CAU 1771]
MQQEFKGNIPKRMTGIILVLIAAVMWGVSGTVAQFLFEKKEFSSEWLVVSRLLIAGVVMLVITRARGEKRIWDVWKHKHDAFSMVLFSIFGMLTVQYTFFAAIQHSNAATATILQYLAPVLIVCYSAIRIKKLPSKIEVFAVVLALIGTFLLVTKGSIYSLSISKLALFWGIASAFSLAFYTLHPLQLLARWGSGIVVGWGMLVGGIAFSFVHPPWKFEGQWDMQSFSAVVFIIIFGTLIAFFFFLESLKHIKAAEASLLACVEPLSAAFLAVVWLQVAFGIIEWIGTACILSTILILSLSKQKKILYKEEV